MSTALPRAPQVGHRLALGSSCSSQVAEPASDGHSHLTDIAGSFLSGLAYSAVGGIVNGLRLSAPPAAPGQVDDSAEGDEGRADSQSGQSGCATNERAERAATSKRKKGGRQQRQYAG